MSTCDTPFESGGLLCATCRKHSPVEGARFCSRLVVKSPAMRVLLARLAPVAHTLAPVLLEGEVGAGKEVVARTLHANSERRAHEFVTVHCSAMGAEALHDTLFHKKTGWLQKPFAGTVFIDELGEMPSATQAALLQRLTRDDRPGASSGANAARLIFATTVPLQSLVPSGRFREDLYYRLTVFTLKVPPLRERREDIMALSAMFLEHEGHRETTLSASAATALKRYAWPGNVRELGNVIKHGVTLSGGATIGLEHLPETLQEAPRSVDASGPLQTLAQVEQAHIARVMAACGGNVSVAARTLGLGRTTLWRKLKVAGP